MPLAVISDRVHTFLQVLDFMCICMRGVGSTVYLENKTKQNYMTGAQVTDGSELEVCGQRQGRENPEEWTEAQAVLGMLPFQSVSFSLMVRASRHFCLLVFAVGINLYVSLGHWLNG